VQNYHFPLTQNSFKYFDYPSNKYDIEVFLYQDHGEEVEERQELKAKQEVEEKTRVEGKTRS
jgi:hypothetical protein